jgi:hypothetical protein
MKLYQISYRKDEWVTVIAGFADDVDVNDLESIAGIVARSELLTNYESWNGNQVADHTVEVEEYDEGDPDVVIFGDETVMSGDEYRQSQNNALPPNDDVPI